MIASRVTIIATSALLAAYAPPVAKAADAPGFYHQISELKLGGTGTSWDHIDYDQASHRAYISRRADGLTVVDVTTNAVVGQVSNAMGSGASAIVRKLDRGFTANTDGSTSIFKLSDLSPVDRISFGDNFDGVVYDAATNILAYQQADNSERIACRRCHDESSLSARSKSKVPSLSDLSSTTRATSICLCATSGHVVYKVSLKDKKNHREVGRLIRVHGAIRFGVRCSQ